MSQRHPPIVDQVRALLRKHPRGPKVVFVPRMQIGATIEQAVTRRLGNDVQGWAGLSCRVLHSYAERLVRKKLLLSKQRALPPAAYPFLAARLASDLEEEFSDLPAPAHMVWSVAEALPSLRGEKVDAARIANGTPREESTAPAVRMIARSYADYEEMLEADGLYDDADVCRWALERVRRDPPPEVGETVFAVIGDTELSSLEAELLDALGQAGRDFYRLGASTPASDAPARMATARFGAVPLPALERSEAGSDDDAGSVQEGATVCRAVGAENEVRAALQAVLSDSTPFDEVEVALAQGRPYRGLLADVAAQAGIDVTFSTGRPALQTRTGQALQGLYEWIQEDFDPALLIRLLRSGLIHLSRKAAPRGEAGCGWKASELATWLAGRRYESGRDGYRQAFTVVREDLEAEVARLEKKGLATDRTEERRRRLERARTFVTDLLRLIPEGEASIAEMATMSLRFLEQYGPVEEPDVSPDEKHSMEETARVVLGRKLDRLRSLPVHYEAPVGHLAGMFREIVERQYVQVERPRPGSVHVVPLERAALSGRSHLYVLGLDSEAFAAPEADEAFLQELKEQQAWTEPEANGAAERTAPGGAEATDAVKWLARRAFERHAGALHLFTNTYDVEKGEERFPASVVLEAEEQANRDTPLASFLPSTSSDCSEEGGDVLIDERTSWLGAHAAGPPQAGENDQDGHAASGREAACARYAWLEPAAASQSACASEEYTCYDGFLGEGPFEELDFTGEHYDGSPVSAGRLETLAKAPYLYFQKYVLGVRPLNEPALEEAGWLDPLRRGDILHECFRRFIDARSDEGPVRLEEGAELKEALRQALDEEKRQLAPPTERIEAAAWRELKADAEIFLRAEARHGAQTAAQPWACEIGFGFSPHRAREGDLEEATITLGDDLKLSLCGRIDRVDELKTGRLAIWDYKTGGAKKYDQSDPLADGARLQWALYAYVLAEGTGREVETSGYFFTGTKEMGTRLQVSPEPYRTEVTEIITRLAEMARAGCFPMNPQAHHVTEWKWRGYAALFPDLKERTDELKAKAKNYPADKPVPLFL